MAIRVGQLGIGHAHAPGWTKALIESSQVEFVGIHEPDPETFAARSDNPSYAGVRWLSERELLGDPSVQAVFIETNIADNLRWARRALNAGKHISIDKPPSPSLTQLREILDLAGSNGLHVNMGYMFRSNLAIRFAIEAARTGMLGKIFKVEAEIPSGDRGPDYRKVQAEMESYPGGMFFELGSHMFDLVVIVLGPPKKVTSILRRDYHETDVQAFIDNAVAVLEYERAMAVVQLWTMEVDGFSHRRFEIYGSNGSIRIEPIENPSKVHLCLAEPQGSYKAGWQTVDVGDRPRYVGDVAEFVEVVKGERPPRYDAAHDLAAHETLLRACGVTDL